jgi:hypothetical protein
MGTLDAVPSPQEAALFAEVGESHKAAGDVQLLQDRLGGTALPANPARTLAPGSNQTKTMASPPVAKKGSVHQKQFGRPVGDKRGKPKKPLLDPLSNKQKVLQSVDMHRRAPLVLAGKSGSMPLCKVKGDTIEMSCNSESACLIEAPLIQQRSDSVEIAFDYQFTRLRNTEVGRHGGIFYGASQSIATRKGNPTIDWIDRKADHGYRVYGNKDLNKINSMSPGKDPNKRWRITIAPDGKASFSAGATTWLRNFTPKIQGPYIGFWCAAGNAAKITNVSIRNVKAVTKKFKKQKLKKKPSGKILTAKKGYGWGSAQLFYSERGGTGDAGHRIYPKSMYLKGSRLYPRSFSTRSFRDHGGDIQAASSVVAERFLVLGARQGYGIGMGGYLGKARMMYVGAGKGTLKGRSLYIAASNFGTQRGSIVAKQDVTAGAQLKMAAKTGFGEGSGGFWFAQEEDRKKGSTVYVGSKTGFETQKGSLSGDEIVAGENLVLKSKARHGHGRAEFWFSKVGKGRLNSNTVYFRRGHFETQSGSIFSAKDLKADRYAKVSAMTLHGNGEAKMWFVADGAAKYKPNSFYVSSNMAIEDGSFESSKNVVAKRSLKIGASKGYGTGTSELWYSRRAATSDSQKQGFKDKSLYVRRGNFGTQQGSMGAARDLIAMQGVVVRPSGEAVTSSSPFAKLWYAHRGSRRLEGASVYLRKGNFGSETGSVVSPKDMGAKKYVEIGALPGFGIAESKIQLWHSAKVFQGKQAATLYQKNGDFRVQKGSIYSNHLIAGQHLSVDATPGYGDGTAQLWFVTTPVGRSDVFPNTLYLKGKTDFRARNVLSARAVSTKHGLKISATKGFGNGNTELWFGKPGGAAGALDKKNTVPNTLYVRNGDFSTEKGSMTAKFDVHSVQGQVKIAPQKHLRGTKATNFAEIWYSESGTQGAASKSIYLRDGDFRTLTGSIGSAKHFSANAKTGTLKAKLLQLKTDMRCTNCKFGKIYIKAPIEKKKTPAQKAAAPPKSFVKVQVPTLLEESTVLLEQSASATRSIKQPVIDVELALRKIQDRHGALKAEESELTRMIVMAKARLDRLATALV